MGHAQRNTSTCTYKYGKDCEIGEFLKDCKCVKSLADDLLVTYDEVADTPESVPINPSDGINY